MIFKAQNDNQAPKTGMPFRKISAFLIISIPIAMILIFSVAVFYHGTPEFRVDKTQHGLKIRKVHHPLNPVQKNDVIIRINGIDYNHILSFLVSFSRPADQGTRQEITILRDGRPIRITPRKMPVPPFDFFSMAWPHLVLMLFMIGLGIIAFFRVSRNQPALLFLAASSMFAATFSATFPSYFGILDPETISLSFFSLALFNWLAFGAYLHFVFSFPMERNLVKSRKWLVPFFYLTAPFVSIAGAWLLAENPNEFWSWLQRVRNLVLPLMAMIAFVKHATDYKKISSTLEKKQVKLIISAYWLSFGPYLILYAIPNILFNNPVISFKFVVMSGAILPGAYFISLIRYRLLDVDKLISRTVSYFLLITLLVISYSSFVIFLKRTFIGRGLFSEELFLIYVIAIAVLFEPLNRLITFIMDKIFLPRALYRYEMIPALSRQIGSTIELKRLIHILIQDFPKDFSITRTKLILFDRDSLLIHPDDPAFYKAELKISHLQSYFEQTADFLFCNTPGLKSDLDKILQYFQKKKIELLFALRGGTGLSGILLLGARADGLPYSRRDVRFFSILANQTGLALENSLHYESLVQSKKQVEQMFGKVVQSEKMAALGEMSTVLAHELKNPLSIIRSSAQFLTKQTNDTEHHQELLKYIIGEVDGLESTINNMMGLARYKIPDLVSIDLYENMTAMVERWKLSGNHNTAIDIQLTAAAEIPRIIADFKQLQQVFLNCISNAEDAMPDGGQIDILLAPAGGHTVEIRISDTGPGIPGENLDNVFKQFFTTKEKGMGIGLSVCRQVITAHNGSITIKNRMQRGLTVIVRLHCNPISAPPLSSPINQETTEISFA